SRTYTVQKTAVSGSGEEVLFQGVFTPNRLVDSVPSSYFLLLRFSESNKPKPLKNLFLFSPVVALHQQPLKETTRKPRRTASFFTKCCIYPECPAFGAVSGPSASELKLEFLYREPNRPGANVAEFALSIDAALNSPSSPSNCSMASTALSCVLWWRWFGILVMFHGMDRHIGIRTGSQAAARTAGGHTAQDTASRDTQSPAESMTGVGGSRSKGTGCSPDLLFFLCAMYAPICTIDFQHEPIKPCKAVCERAKSGCEPVMKRYNHSWPDSLACSELPLYDRGVCISPEAIVKADGPDPYLQDPSRCNPESSPDFPMDPNNFHCQGANGVRCKCKTVKMGQKTYVNNNYNYVIRARVREVRNRGLEPTAVVDVKEVLKSSLVNIPKEMQTLYYSSSCLCPPLTAGEEYIIMGYENEERSRLLLIDSSIAQKWKDKMRRKVKARALSPPTPHTHTTETVQGHKSADYISRRVSESAVRLRSLWCSATTGR
ncbi:hypothetical protein CCH79_00017145, partial [Gambusia affinis]